CCGRRSDETKTGELPVYGSSRKPSTSAVVGTMDLPLTLSAKPQPPGLNRSRKCTCKNHNPLPLITYFKQKRNPTAL
ncbi:hypothetical protein, partial [Sporosarcina sp. P29]|uniref:hypothetical protein n=1 Tax=Sporosarcina sp. P29 TaxID=2048252 RepID=UPI001E3A92C2